MALYKNLRDLKEESIHHEGIMGGGFNHKSGKGERVESFEGIEGHRPGVPLFCLIRPIEVDCSGPGKLLIRPA